ncbi:MAG: M23 family metallopeptidase [Deltaproteobacteria bacterium]|nr:M23 family metallopeptidase [Deltaproteobacteria bacterium]
MAVYTGTRLVDNEISYLEGWKGMIKQQQARIAATRQDAEVELDALTLRIGRMQAQMMRLNALGERLVGGPGEMPGTESVQFADFLSMLDQMDSELDDRREMLSVLEVLLMSRSLHERVMPSGKPVNEGWLSSKYGKRNDPFTGKKDFHKGLDFAGKKGADVLAVGDGVVSWSGKRQGYGNLVEINHGNGYVTRYGHNQQHLVEVGDTVKKGQQVAMMGSTGRSTGPHVHFEVLHNGKRVNPAKYIGK